MSRICETKSAVGTAADSRQPRAGGNEDSRPYIARNAAGRALVAYSSRTSNTAVVARQIGRAKDATIYEIITARTYPEDYEETAV